MLKGFARVRRWEQTDDVLQNSLLRLWGVLHQVTPDSVRHYFLLATLQIRRELIDLARSYHGPEGPGANHHTDGADPDGRLARVAQGGGGPETLEAWAAFHEAVDRLPEDERREWQKLWANVAAMLRRAGDPN